MEPMTVGLLVDTRRRLEDIQEYLKSREPDDTIVKTRARWAYNSAVNLVAALQQEGGKVPSASGEADVGTPEEVSLLPDPFARDN